MSVLIRALYALFGFIANLSLKRKKLVKFQKGLPELFFIVLFKPSSEMFY